ncbi:MAG: serine/threonine-protein kinase [Clostridia bacterium]|nr:serine/threonine-protein kinase [Clostridia bacterium]
MQPNQVERLCMCCMGMKADKRMVCPHCGGRAEVENESNQLPVGSILSGKYLIGRALGQGGFGITYIAMDLNLEIRAAIKEYYPVDLVAREQTAHATIRAYSERSAALFASGREKFAQEARTLVQFSNLPGIVRVRDFFYDNGTAYIVMDYVDGRTLKETLAANGKLDAQWLLQGLRPLMGSLGAIHARGLLHRDISPDNIMLDRDGSLRLLDFGSARQISTEGEHSNTINVKHGYAPPEQYQTRGKQGPWTDVYALCATIYKLTTGVTPQQSLDRLGADDLLKPGALGATLTPQQEAAVMKGLSLRIENRYPSIAELTKALYTGSGAAPQTDTPPKGSSRVVPPTPQPKAAPQADAPKRKGNPWIGVLIGFLLVAAAVIVPSIDFTAPTPEERAQAEQLVGQIAANGTPVYWIPFGKTFHVDPECHNIRDSNTAYSGTVEVAFAAKCSEPCEDCVLGVDMAQAAFAPAETQQSASAPAEASESVLLGDLYDYSVMLEGEVYQLPLSLETLLDRGWRLDSDAGVAQLEAGTGTELRLNQGNKMITVRIFNVRGKAADIMDCQIDSMILEKRGNIAVKLPHGIELGTATPEDVRAALGEANTIRALESFEGQPGRYELGYDNCGGAGIHMYMEGFSFDFDPIAKTLRKVSIYRRLNSKVLQGYNCISNEKYRDAAELFAEAAQYGYTQAEYELGVCYQYGVGVKQDYTKAAELFAKAADKGKAEAQTNLGVLYAEGKGVTEDLGKALELFNLAAAQGETVSMTNLGDYYYNGIGVEQNYETAVDWYRKAAEQGYAVAQSRLGQCYALGRFVTQNYEKAFYWYKQAAEQGNVDAQYNLGVMYYNAYGVEGDEEEAKKWWTLAAAQGNQEAQAALEQRFPA